MVQIAVMGYGTVGSGVVEVLNTNQASINKRAGDEINIKYVLDLRDFPGDPVESKLIHDFETIVNDPEIKIVVEVMAVSYTHLDCAAGLYHSSGGYAGYAESMRM